MSFKGTNEFLNIIENYLVDRQKTTKILKDGSLLDQGLRDIISKRNKDIKKHEMDDDEAEKYTSNRGTQSNNNKLNNAMQKIKNETKKNFKKNEEFDKSKIKINLPDFMSEKLDLIIPYKKNSNNSINNYLTKTRQLSLGPTSFVNFTNEDHGNEIEPEKEYEFKQSLHSKKSSSINLFSENKKPILNNNRLVYSYISRNNVNSNKSSKFLFIRFFRK